MKAKYNLPLLHEHCLAWCEKPVFLPWQEAYGYYCEKRSFAYVIQSKTMDSDRATCFFELGDYSEVAYLFEFANFIGLDVESYRIRETYKTAVERYLSTVENKQQLWVRSPFFKTVKDGTIRAADTNDYIVVPLSKPSNAWGDDCIHWYSSYCFLRLDLNPDYKID